MNVVGYTRRNGLSIALHTCHEEFLEALINLGKSSDDVGQNQLLTVSILHSLHLENVSGLSLYHRYSSARGNVLTVFVRWATVWPQLTWAEKCEDVPHFRGSWVPVLHSVAWAEVYRPTK